MGPGAKQMVERWFTVSMLRPGKAVKQFPNFPTVALFPSGEGGWSGEAR